MNRQLVAFLSMFSLVLVLSIYYVMLPTRGQAANRPVVSEIVEGTDPYFETILLEQTTHHEQVIAEQYAIVASSEYSNAEKALALEMIAREQETMNNEKLIREIILGSDFGFPACFVEIGSDGVFVLTISETKSMAEVAEIIYFVQDVLEKECPVQVSFRS